MRVALLAFAFASFVACGEPKHPPTSGPVGASGTCLVTLSRADAPSAGQQSGPGEGDYGYVFEEDEGPRVNLVIERGHLRELEVVMQSAEPEPTVRIRPPSGEITDQNVLSGRAKELDVPLVVGQWASVPLQLSWSARSDAPVTRAVRIRIVGMGAEAQVADGPLLRGGCVWGPTDRDPQ